MAGHRPHCVPERAQAFALSLSLAPKTTALAWLAARVIGAVIVVPLTEELAFRSFLLSYIEKRCSAVLAPRFRGAIALLTSSLTVWRLARRMDRWNLGWLGFRNREVAARTPRRRGSRPCHREPVVGDLHPDYRPLVVLVRARGRKAQAGIAIACQGSCANAIRRLASAMITSWLSPIIPCSNQRKCWSPETPGPLRRRRKPMCDADFAPRPKGCN